MQASSNPYGLNNFLQRWAKDNPPKLSFKARTRAAAKTWKRRFVAELKKAIGPMPKPGSLRVRRAGTRRRRGFRIEMLYLKASPWHEVPVHLLVPEDAKRAPVVLALHGHGAGALGTRNGKDPTYRGYAAEYAKRGFVVATPEFYPFGQRLQTDHFHEGFEVACNGRFVAAMLYGFTTLALNVSDVMRTLDYLGRRPEADLRRVGCMGLSYGGTVTMYTSVLEKRIKRVVLGCSFGSIPGHGLFLDELCGGQVVPGIMRLGDMAEIAGCIAPRPLLLEAATNDTCFPWKWTKSELPRLRRIYEAFGAADRLRVDTFDDGHRFYGDTALEWFDKL